MLSWEGEGRVRKNFKGIFEKRDGGQGCEFQYRTIFTSFFTRESHASIKKIFSSKINLIFLSAATKIDEKIEIAEK